MKVLITFMTMMAIMASAAFAQCPTHAKKNKKDAKCECKDDCKCKDKCGCEKK